MDNYEYCVTWAADRGRVLDFGCGMGRTVQTLRDRGTDAWGCDPVIREHTPTSVRPFLMRMEGGIPAPDKSFDVVTSNYVFEHVTDMESTLSEIARVLKPGGELLALYPDRYTLIEGHCHVPFAHWFGKGSRVRPYYVAAVRALGIGGARRGRSFMQYGRDVGAYIDRATCYRSPREFRALFDKYFDHVRHIESEWLTARKTSGRALRALASLPAALQPVAVRRLAGCMVVATKAR
jgi:SAM-dependent methyltransferase